MFPDIRSFMPAYNMGTISVESLDSSDSFRYLWGTKIKGQELSLPLTPITTVEKGLIVDHYQEHGLGLDFQIPANMFCYISGGNVVLPTTLRYRYAQSLGVQRLSPGWWACQVVLITA